MGYYNPKMKDLQLLSFFAAAAFVVAAMIPMTVTAFAPAARQCNQVRNDARTSNTRIFVEESVFDMVAEAYARQKQNEEEERRMQEKLQLQRRDTTTVITPEAMMMMNANELEAHAQFKRDERMAFKHPDKYCADRCVATGNCAILQDFYELSPDEVLNFCEECVLNDSLDDDDDDGGGSCDVPDAFYTKEPPLRP